MEKHPNLIHRKHKNGMSHERFKTLWTELTDYVNGLPGTKKSVKGWTKVYNTLQVKFNYVIIVSIN